MSSSTTTNLGQLKVHKVPSLELWKEQYGQPNGIGENDVVAFNPELFDSYVTAGQATGVSLGEKATAEGNNTFGVGNYSHAEGSSSAAMGHSSHAEGIGTKAEGIASHAEGITSQAIGQYSHAEGNNTLAYGNNSHTEGEGNIITVTITGEGNSTQYISNGDSSNYLGRLITYGTTTAKIIKVADKSHELVGTLIETDVTLSPTDIDHGTAYILTGAIGTNSSAINYQTVSFGNGSSAKGNNTLSYGDYSSAEGNLTKAIGDYSHAEGYLTTSRGIYSHSEGGGFDVIGIPFSGTPGDTTYLIQSPHHIPHPTLRVGQLISFQDVITKVTSMYSTGGGIVLRQYHFTTEVTLSSTVSSGIAIILNGSVGDYSHTEGYQTNAYGIAAHAEGHGQAIEDYSHAEGNGSAYGTYSHAEGAVTVASGQYSHAEGLSTTASGYSTHAEGSNTTASGRYSHVEGYHTTASHQSQHVFGEFNELDSSAATSTQRGTYVEIVGNGTSDSNRSNVRTLDWNGNEWIAGTLTVGDNPQLPKQVATKEYVDDHDTLGYITVDSNTGVGTLTNPEWNHMYVPDSTDRGIVNNLTITLSQPTNLNIKNEITVLFWNKGQSNAIYPSITMPGATIDQYGLGAYEGRATQPGHLGKIVITYLSSEHILAEYIM